MNLNNGANPQNKITSNLNITKNTIESQHKTNNKTYEERTPD